MMNPANMAEAPGQFRYCPRCATPLVATDENGHARPGCPSCGFIHYRNPTPAVGAVVLADGYVLLVRRKYEPRAGLWSMPAGFMEYDESPETCVLRELGEETGLTGAIKGLVGVYPAGDDPRTRVVLIVYHVLITGGTEIPGDDAEEVGYFPIDNYPQLAWSSHERALKDFLSQTAGGGK